MEPRCTTALRHALIEWKHQVGQTNETRTRTNQLLNMTFSTTTVACLMNACSSGLCSVSFLNPDSSNPPRPIREKSPLKGAAGIGHVWRHGRYHLTRPGWRSELLWAPQILPLRFLEFWNVWLPRSRRKVVTRWQTWLCNIPRSALHRFVWYEVSQRDPCNRPVLPGAVLRG